MLFRSAKFHAKTFSIWEFPQNNLCDFVSSYFRQLLKFAIVTFIIGFVATSVITFDLAVIKYGFIDLIGGGSGSVYLVFLAFGESLTVILILAAIGILLGFTIHKIKNKWFPDRWDDNRAPSVIGEYFRAKKRKYCPRLEFK